MEKATLTVKGERSEIRFERLTSHIGALLDESSPQPTNVVKFHENVVGNAGPLVLQLDGRDQEFHSMNFYQDHLRTIVEKIAKRSKKQKPKDEFYRALLAQVTRGVQHLKNHQMCPKDLRPDTIIFSCDGKIIAIRNCLDGWSDNCLKQLGKVFFFVLTEGRWPDQETVDSKTLVCEDKEIARDVLDRMLQQTIQIDEILAHPFFWGELQKMSFIVDVFDSIKKQEEFSQQQKAELDKDPLKIVDGDWTEKLEIQSHEVSAILGMKGAPKQIALRIIQDKARETSCTTSAYTYNPADKSRPVLKEIDSDNLHSLSQNDIDSVVKNAAKNLVNDEDAEVFLLPQTVYIKRPGKCVYDKTSLYDLLRFFRNCKAHYWEMKKNVKICFQEYPTGFWRFFSDRYPKLLLYLHEKSKTMNFFNAYKNFSVANETIPALDT